MVVQEYRPLVLQPAEHLLYVPAIRLWLGITLRQYLFNFDLLPSENLHASESRRLGCTDHDDHQLWRDYPDRVEPYANDADLSSSDDRKYAVNDTTGRESAAGGR